MKEEFPIKVGRFGRVSIYEAKVRHGDREYVNYRVAYSHQGRQIAKSFAELKKAKDYASERAREVDRGQISVLSLDASAGASYRLALENLKPCGVTLEFATSQFAEAYRILGGLSLIDAARQAARSHRGLAQNVTVRETIAALLKDRLLKGVSEKHLYNLNRVLTRFVEVFQDTRLASIDGPLIKGFLDKLDRRAPGGGRRPVTSRTKNNYRAAIGQVFEFAKFQKFVSKDHESIEHIAKYKEDAKATEVYTPAEIERLLTVASARALEGYQDLVPFLAIGAFAGIRHEEIVRLEWKDVALTGGYIAVQAGNAKTAARRVVPIHDNLARWLAPYSTRTGLVCAIWREGRKRNVAEPLSRFAECEELKGFSWKRNALRHSFISYRLAEINDVARVALEAGNSPHMVHRHYKQLVTDQQAREWFAVAPGGRKVLRFVPAAA